MWFVYSDEAINSVLREFKAGTSLNSIARSTGISRRSLARWRAGHRPLGCEAPIGPNEVATSAPAEYAYLLGLYLGDGHLVESQRDCWALRLALDAAYPEIIEGAKAAMLACRGRGKASGRQVPGSNCVIVTSYSKAWPGLFPQHGPGKKHERLIVLEPWQEQLTRTYARDLIRGLIHSDGCRYTAKQRVGGRIYEYDRYGFENHSDGVRLIFINHLDLLDVAWTRPRRTLIQIARREAVARMDTFVGPKR
jgi:hypothetical protein